MVFAGQAGAAQTEPAAAAQREPVPGQAVTAQDVAMTPIHDLNLKKDPIPPILLQARAAPYGDADTGSCDQILREMVLLDAALGEDYDTAAAPKARLTPAGAAQQVIEFLIPFDGIIRAVSGANKHEWEFREAISAGLMRRAYLKGRGSMMGCAYPAAPAAQPASHADTPHIEPAPVTPVSVAATAPTD